MKLFTQLFFAAIIALPSLANSWWNGSPYYRPYYPPQPAYSPQLRAAQQHALFQQSAFEIKKASDRAFALQIEASDKRRLATIAELKQKQAVIKEEMRQRRQALQKDMHQTN